MGLSVASGAQRSVSTSVWAAGGATIDEDDAARLQEVGDGECGFAAVAAHGRDGGDQIAKGELRTMGGLQGLVHGG